MQPGALPRAPRQLLVALLLLSVVAACQSEPRHPLRTAAVVDSVVAPEVAITRFRAGLVEPTVLAGGAPTRDSLFHLALGALSGRDTALIRRLTLTKAEFAWLYYPTNPQALPPYDLDPQLMWFLLLGNSDNGLRKALNAYGGRSLGYRGGRCEGDSSVQGANVLWGPCWLDFTEPGKDQHRDRLLGLIIRRGGSYKIVSWANKLD